MKSRTLGIPPLLTLLAILAAGNVAQSDEPLQLPAEAQETWGDRKSWPLLSPGDIEIDYHKIMNVRTEFVFRSRLHKEDPRSERRIWTVDGATYKGASVLVANLTDLGNWEHEDLFARNTTWLVAPKTLALVSRLGADPLSSTQRIIRVLPDKVINTVINEDGTSETTTTEGAQPAFGYRYFNLLLASMSIEEGMKFRVAEYDFWEGGLVDEYIRVRGKTRIKDASGHEREVWRVSWLSDSGWLTDYFIGDEAPYYFGQEVRNYTLAEGTQPIYSETYVGMQKLR